MDNCKYCTEIKISKTNKKCLYWFSHGIQTQYEKHGICDCEHVNNQEKCKYFEKRLEEIK